MSERFHSPNHLAEGAVVDLDLEESHHLLRVMRAQPGDELRVFGSGREFSAVLERTAGRIATVKLTGEVAVAPRPRLKLTFAIPWLKGGRTEWIAEKLTELGAAGMVLYCAAREVAKASNGKVDRLRKVALAAAKQCGRADLPAILSARSLREAALLSGQPPERTLILMERSDGLRLCEALRRAGAPETGPVFVASGPEGGLAPEDTGTPPIPATMVSMGPRILRAETAPVAAAAALLAAAGDL